MPSPPIRLPPRAFVGMNNVKKAEGSLSEPHVIVNADVSDEGRLVGRQGYYKILSLQNGQVIWSNGEDVCLYQDGNGLYRLQDDCGTLVANVAGPATPLYFVEVDHKIYISNEYWSGIYNPDIEAVSSWGLDLPEQPVLIPASSGGFTAGVYRVCFTNSNGQEISGNGPVALIELQDNQGIRVLNRPPNGIVWCTDPNGSELQRVGTVDTILSPASVEPISSIHCSPPFNMTHLTYALGRIWGAYQKKLYYSKPYHPEWFELSFDFLDLGFDPTMIAPTPNGIYIGSAKETFFFAGTTPNEMRQVKVGVGAVSGFLVYLESIENLGDNLPMWLCPTGFVVGTPEGQVINLTKSKLWTAVGDKAAGYYKVVDGMQQVLAAFRRGDGKFDPVVAGIFQSGKAVPREQRDGGDRAGVGDAVECTVIRNGQVVPV